jgi:hypothetical protein
MDNPENIVEAIKNGQSENIVEAIKNEQSEIIVELATFALVLL